MVRFAEGSKHTVTRSVFAASGGCHLNQGWMRAKPVPGELQIYRTFRRLAILTPILSGDRSVFCLIVTQRASSLPSIEIVQVYETVREHL